MIEFRGSRTGKCLREIVTAELLPSKCEPPKSMEVFLSAGHDHQVTVTRFLQQQGLLISEVESMVEYVSPEGFRIQGHIDGLVMGAGESFPPSLLEIKAVKSATFGKLKKLTRNWKTNPSFESYVTQMNTYMGCLGLTEGYLVVYDRNTSNMVSALTIDHPQHTTRHDLLLEFDEVLWEQTLLRHAEAAAFIEEEKFPGCDKGQCWFCGTVFHKAKPTKKDRTMGQLQGELSGLEAL